MGCDSVSMMSSELESSSFIDSEEDENASRSGLHMSDNFYNNTLCWILVYRPQTEQFYRPELFVSVNEETQTQAQATQSGQNRPGETCACVYGSSVRVVPFVTPSHFLSQSSSFSSITDSTMSLNIITVTLNMGKINLPHKRTYCTHITISHFSVLFLTEKYNFLGISIVGQSNDRGDGGIYIGSIMKGGAVAADGRIEPGDMLLQVSWSF